MSDTEISATTKRRRSPRLRQRRVESATAYFFIAPYLVITLVFTIGVIAFAVYVSFTSYNLFTEPEWQGLGNYFKAFRSHKFITSLVNVGWYVAIVVPVQTALALFLAIFSALFWSG